MGCAELPDVGVAIAQTPVNEAVEPPTMVTVPEITPVPAVPNVNWSERDVEEVDPPAVTVTSTVSELDPDGIVSAGEVAVQEVVEEQVTLVAWVVPKSTVVDPVPVEKPDPEIVTEVPPAAGPEFGLILDTVGAVPELLVGASC